MDHSWEFKVGRLESNRYAVVPGLRVYPQSPSAHRFPKIDGNLLILVFVGFVDLTLIDILPNNSVFGGGNGQLSHPGRLIATALHDNSRKIFKLVHADLGPLTKLIGDGCPGRVAVEHAVGGRCAGEGCSSSKSYCING